MIMSLQVKFARIQNIWLEIFYLIFSNLETVRNEEVRRKRFKLEREGEILKVLFIQKHGRTCIITRHNQLHYRCPN